MRVFTSLKDLNQFLTEQGLPELTNEEVNAQMAAANERGEDSVRIEFDLGSDTVDEEEQYVSKAKFDAYIEMSCDQILAVSKQRDEAIAERDAEIKDHLQCHEAFDEAMHQIRARGYAEATARGLFSKPFTSLNEEVRKDLYEAALKQITEDDAAFAKSMN